ncbi:GNAT family N-acetyltransferase [Pseudonocardia alaniniphila]|uniref:GNAT family N-acetyltransferase n=1 Tax=Pseudonocardia alaniniphila TaxID=75291 RepID=A0ABS9THP0_9PSEU|nr:GNAT family N-acetyltransferase [Pseudonocardia alaniniphila]MCH6168052.1 GNAT family N-acetyltransferase [Pseudonocardia alaniniphila]
MELTADEVTDLVEQFWSLGGESVDLGLGRLVRSPAAPGHPLGNFLTSLRVGSEDQLVSLLADVEAITGAPCRRVLISPRTPPTVEALLVLNDWSLDTQLQLVLPASVTVGPAALMLETARDDEDWRAIEELFRIDHIEEDGRARRAERPVSETHAALLLRRSLLPATYFVAHRDSRTVGCIGVWTRSDGAAMIEDVFVHPEARGKGIASEMLRFAVGAARQRGSGPVLIGAEVDDTPKRLYARFGFRPIAVTRSYSASRAG